MIGYCVFSSKSDIFSSCHNDHLNNEIIQAVQTPNIQQKQIWLHKITLFTMCVYHIGILFTTITEVNIDSAPQIHLACGPLALATLLLLVCDTHLPRDLNCAWRSVFDWTGRTLRLGYITSHCLLVWSPRWRSGMRWKHTDTPFTKMTANLTFCCPSAAHSSSYYPCFDRLLVTSELHSQTWRAFYLFHLNSCFWTAFLM